MNDEATDQVTGGAADMMLPLLRVGQGRAFWYAADAVIAAAFIGFIQAEVWVLGPLANSDLSKQVSASVVGAIAGATVAARSKAPAVAFIINSVTMFVLVGLGYESNYYQWSNLVLLYSVAEASRALKPPIFALATSLLGVAFYFAALPVDDKLGTGSLVGLTWILIWLAGRMAATRRQARVFQNDRDLATALAATNQERVELQTQRADMARELHDLIGHTVNVMVVHAGAARRAIRTDPDGAERSVGTIESVGRDALAELDRVLGVLRTEGDGPGIGGTAPAPGIPDLSDLASQFDGAGLATSVEVDGRHDRVPAGVSLAIYRIIQESLTNALKHGDATGATARVVFDDHRIRVTVEDDGTALSNHRGIGADPIVPGRGLRGISERAALLGGRVEYGPRDGGGFLVNCELPISAGVAPVGHQRAVPDVR